MSFHISESADADVTAAAVAYDSKPDRNGDAFKAEFAQAARAIMAAPRQYSPVEDGIPGREIREFFIERFKQRVIYLMNGDDVLVIAVVHATRREGAWHRNLPTDLPPEAT